MSDALPPEPWGDRPQPDQTAPPPETAAGAGGTPGVEGTILDAGVGAPDPWSAPADVLVAGPLTPAERTRGRGLAALVAGAVAVVLVGGAAFAWAAFNGDTGDQPEKHLPGATGAFVKIDLDPSGDQKIEAVRFFARFPFGGGLRGSGGEDPRRYLYEQLTKGQPAAPPWDQVEPWLGQRAAVAAVPGASGGGIAPVALLQVTDEAKAKAALARAATKGAAFSVADGWATLSDTQAHLDAVIRATATSALSDDATFRADVDALGDPGVVAGWADTARLPTIADALGGRQALALVQSLAGVARTVSPAAGAQRYALVARFSGGDAELAARTFGGTGTPGATGAGTAVAALPAGTMAALGVAGAGDAFRARWPALSAAAGPVGAGVTEVEQQTGLKLPQDLEALLGQRVALALAEPDGSGQPVVGLAGRSSASGLGAALDRLLVFTDQSGLPLERRDVEGGYVLATARSEAEAMTREGGLGNSAAFRAAVPDAGKAQVVAYVDVQRLLATYARSVDPDVAATLAPVHAVGLAVTPTSDGTALSLRVTTR